MKHWQKIISFINKYAECKDGNSKRFLCRYYDDKDKILNPQKLYYEKNGDKIYFKTER